MVFQESEKNLQDDTNSLIPKYQCSGMTNQLTIFHFSHFVHILFLCGQNQLTIFHFSHFFHTGIVLQLKNGQMRTNDFFLF